MTLDVKEEDRLAALGDLRELIRISQERGELEVLKGADPHLEIGALYELSLKDRHPPLILFEDMVGHPSNHKILMNVRFSRLFSGDVSLNALKEYRANRKGGGEAPIPPEWVNGGPVTENIVRGDKVNVNLFPAGK